MINIKIPKHDDGLAIYHNNYKWSFEYKDMLDYINFDSNSLKFKSEEHKERAIKTDSLWEIMWYRTIGERTMSLNLGAPTLEELLVFAYEVDATIS